MEHVSEGQGMFERDRACSGETVHVFETQGMFRRDGSCYGDRMHVLDRWAMGLFQMVHLWQL